jgi:phage anti-repressor protein
VTESEFLDARELHQLTGYARRKQQGEWLRAREIPFQDNGRSLVVRRVNASAWADGQPLPQPVVSSWKPDFSKPF